VTKLIRDFPDQYWLEKENAHAYPWEFYNAFAKAARSCKRCNSTSCRLVVDVLNYV